VKAVDQTKNFVIERPKGIEPGTTAKLTNGALRKAKTWSLFHPDHLALEGTTELKKNQLLQGANMQAQKKYLEVLDKTGVLDVRIAALATAAKVPESKLEDFTKDIQELATSPNKPEAIEGIVKKFKIKLKSFEQDATELSEAYQETMLDLLDDFKEMSEDEVLQDFEKRMIEIQKREIEILCDMPKGHMSVMDNLTNIAQHLQGMYLYTKKAHQAAHKATSGNEPPSDNAS